MPSNYFLVYFHDTEEFALQEITSSTVYIGSVGSTNPYQQSSLNNRLNAWKHYLANHKNLDVSNAQLLTLSIGSNKVKPLITLRKKEEQWKCFVGIPNHNPNDYLVTISNDSIIVCNKETKHKIATFCLSPSVFHLILSQEKDKLTCRLAINDEKQILMSYTMNLPYSDIQLQAINTAFEYIEWSQIRESQWNSYEGIKPEVSQDEQNILSSLGYWKNDHLVIDFHRQVGMKIYESLFHDRLKYLIKQYSSHFLGLRLNLHLYPEDFLMFQFPWELIHDNGNFLSATGLIKLIRIIEKKIEYKGARPTMESNKVKILFVNPSKNIRNKKSVLRRAITSSKKNEMVDLNRESVRTWKKFIDRILSLETIDILHFDGHTSYSKRCNNCLDLNKHNAAQCDTCGVDLGTTKPISFIEFEHKTGEHDLVMLGKLTDALVNRVVTKKLKPIKLAIFTSCDSARIRNRDFESVIAPALLNAGALSVIAMQGRVLSSSLEVFVKNIYSELLNNKCLVDAVSTARIQMEHDEFLPAWFMPVIYTSNSRDDCIFKIQIKEL